MTQKNQMILLAMLVLIMTAVWYFNRNTSSVAPGSVATFQKYQLLAVENPQLHRDKMEVAQKTEYHSLGRNPFSEVAPAAKQPKPTKVVPREPVGPPVLPPPPPPAVTPPSFMVFFDWDRSNLSQQALTTIQQAANAFKAKGSARITATGHTDTSGPESYNMALSLRRANAVKDALVRNGVPAQAITVVGMGEKGLLVQTGDNVREPQNRRVEIVIQ